jgi:plasmid stabilization system protein ParE
VVKRKKPKYLFTCAGKEAWEYAKRYSKRQFPNETRQYFSDVIDVIEKLADSPHSYAYRDDLAAGTGLKIYGARKHYLIFDILPDGRIAIVGFEKKERDILGILSKQSSTIREELSRLR